MKKREFNTVVFNRLDEPENKVVTGFVSKFFGVYKDGKQYTVSHLGTGYKLCNFMKLKHAKDYVSRLEAADFPVSWDNNDVAQLQSNSPLALDLARLSNKI